MKTKLYEQNIFCGNFSVISFPDDHVAALPRDIPLPDGDSDGSMALTEERNRDASQRRVAHYGGGLVVTGSGSRLVSHKYMRCSGVEQCARCAAVPDMRLPQGQPLEFTDRKEGANAFGPCRFRHGSAY